MAELWEEETTGAVGGTESGPRRVRHPGEGRKRLAEKHPEVMRELEGLVEPVTRGDPMSPPSWTTKSTRVLADELRGRGHWSAMKIRQLLQELGYSVQGTREVRESSSHPDRDEQFQHSNAEVTSFQEAGEPTISVDTKKKENLGDFANNGRDWQPKDQPAPALVPK